MKGAERLRGKQLGALMSPRHEAIDQKKTEELHTAIFD